MLIPLAQLILLLAYLRLEPKASVPERTLAEP
jgi:hypothetical protein